MTSDRSCGRVSAHLTSEAKSVRRRCHATAPPSYCGHLSRIDPLRRQIPGSLEVHHPRHDPPTQFMVDSVEVDGWHCIPHKSSNPLPMFTSS